MNRCVFILMSNSRTKERTYRMMLISPDGASMFCLCTSYWWIMISRIMDHDKSGGVANQFYLSVFCLPYACVVGFSMRQCIPKIFWDFITRPRSFWKFLVPVHGSYLYGSFGGILQINDASCWRSSQSLWHWSTCHLRLLWSWHSEKHQLLFLWAFTIPFSWHCSLHCWELKERWLYQAANACTIFA